MDPNIVFQNGGTYNVVIPNTSSTPVNPNTPIERNVTIGLNLINASGRTVRLDGDVVFVLANPDVYGIYSGWEGPYNRTGHLNFNTGAVTIGAGDSKVVTVTSDIGGRSPLSPDWLDFAGRKSNVLLYIGGDSEVVICNNMDNSIVFQNGVTYNVVFR
jgi:hypothetical protein